MIVGKVNINDVQEQIKIITIILSIYKVTKKVLKIFFYRVGRSDH